MTGFGPFVASAGTRWTMSISLIEMLQPIASNKDSRHNNSEQQTLY